MDVPFAAAYFICITVYISALNLTSVGLLTCVEFVGFKGFERGFMYLLYICPMFFMGV